MLDEFWGELCEILSELLGELGELFGDLSELDAFVKLGELVELWDELCIASTIGWCFNHYHVTVYRVRQL